MIREKLQIEPRSSRPAGSQPTAPACRACYSRSRPAGSTRVIVHVLINPPAGGLAPQIDADAAAKKYKSGPAGRSRSSGRTLVRQVGSAYILSSRSRHFGQVTSAAGGSAHPELLPGSTNTAPCAMRTHPSRRRATNARPSLSIMCIYHRTILVEPRQSAAAPQSRRKVRPVLFDGTTRYVLG